MDSILDNEENIALTKWYIQEKQLDKALKHIKPVINGKEPNTEALIIAARLYAQLQLFNHAQTLFEKYLEKHSDDINIIFQLGMTYFDNGEQDKALDAWLKILEKAPGHPPALFYCAIARLQKGETELALSQLKHIINTAQVDNLYYEKAKELIVQVETQTPDLDRLTPQNVYDTEH